MERRAGCSEVVRVDADLELRPMSPEQAEELYALVAANRERLHEWMPWLGSDYSLDVMRQYLWERAADNAKRASFSATIRRQGRICGAISLHQINQRNRSSSIGYWLAKEAEGQGIMLRACEALLDLAFGEYGLHRIEIRCATGNLRSKAIPRRLGFTEEGLLRQAEWLHGRWVDLRVFAILSTEWRASGPV